MEGETVIAGVDTHKDVHVLCLLDGLGRKIWSGSFGADPEGYDRLAEAIGDPGSCMVVGVEGTASYGAGLTRRLVELGYNVVKAGDALEESVLASLRSVAAVWKEARSQVESLDERIRALLEANAPALLGVEGCGTTTAAALVVAAGDNPGRLKGEAAFSMMCGASPIPASSGKTDRHRLNRGGNRQANWALYEIAIKRMAYDERTRRYVARRTSEGKSRREAVRCLKRYIAREVYHVLMDPNPDGAAPEGPELAKMRKAMRVTQKKAAAELGLSAATLGHLERGKRRSTKLERRYYELLCELERTLPQTAS